MEQKSLQLTNSAMKKEWITPQVQVISTDIIQVGTVPGIESNLTVSGIGIGSGS